MLLSKTTIILICSKTNNCKEVTFHIVAVIQGHNMPANNNISQNNPPNYSWQGVMDFLREQELRA